jgi:hypothetical protein
MAVLVVDRLEAGDVDDEQRGVLAVAPAPLDPARELGVRDGSPLPRDQGGSQPK